MSRSTRKAIAGMQAAEEGTHERCMEAVRRYASIQSAEDLAAVYGWAKDFDWFLRSQDDEAAMRRADKEARERIARTAEAAEKFGALPRRDQAAAVQVADLMRHPERITQSVVDMLGGNYTADVVRLDELAHWVSADGRTDVAAQFMGRIVRAELRMETEGVRAAAISRAAFVSLDEGQRRGLVATISAAVEANRAGFYESFPQFRPPAA